MTDPTFIIFMNLVNFLAPFLKKLWGWALSAVITRSFAVDGEARSSAKCRSKAKCRSDPKWGESYDPSGSVLPACPGKKCWIFFLPRMVGYHDTMIGGGLPKPGNSGKNYNHHDFPEGPLWDFITHSFSDWPHETERKVLGHPNETLCEQSQLSGQLVLVLFRLANASDVCPCSFWLKAGDHKCHRSVPFASWKYMSLYIYIYLKASIVMTFKIWLHISFTSRLTQIHMIKMNIHVFLPQWLQTQGSSGWFGNVEP